MNKDINGIDIDTNDWYTSKEAVTVLSHNSDRSITSDHVRALARRGILRTLKVTKQKTYYYRQDVDSYIVEDRGVKLSRKRKVVYSEKKTRMKMIKKPQKIGDMVFDPNTLGQHLYRIHVECLLSFEGKPILDSPTWDNLLDVEQERYRIMAMGLTRYVSREIHNGKVLIY